MTPSGPRPRSKTFSVTPDCKIVHSGSEIHVIDESGTVLYKGPHTPGVSRHSPSMDSGWITYASHCCNPRDILYNFSTTWEVPPAPATDNGQTLFLFPGIEPASYETILQPVLQWGCSAAGGGPYWSIASWYVGNGTALYTPLIEVDAGTSLTGTMRNTRINKDGTFSYCTHFKDYPDTKMQVVNCPQLRWLSETLESYGVKAKSDYPTGTTAMKDINVEGPTVSWIVTNDLGDGLETVVVVDGSVNGEVDFVYPNPACPFSG